MFQVRLEDGTVVNATVIYNINRKIWVLTDDNGGAGDGFTLEAAIESLRLFYTLPDIKQAAARTAITEKTNTDPVVITTPPVLPPPV